MGYWKQKQIALRVKETQRAMLCWSEKRFQKYLCKSKVLARFCFAPLKRGGKIDIERQISSGIN